MKSQLVEFRKECVSNAGHANIEPNTDLLWFGLAVGKLIQKGQLHKLRVRPVQFSRLICCCMEKLNIGVHTSCHCHHALKRTLIPGKIQTLKIYTQTKSRQESGHLPSGKGEEKKQLTWLPPPAPRWPECMLATALSPLLPPDLPHAGTEHCQAAPRKQTLLHLRSAASQATDFEASTIRPVKQAWLQFLFLVTPDKSRTADIRI